MKSYQSFFNEFQQYITPSDIIEFLYCKRFTYFMRCLGIEQNEGKRYKVQLGRQVHEKREKENRNYLRKKIGSRDKQTEVQLVSNKLGIRGKVDEIHTLKDGTMAPLDYKFAQYKEKLYSTYRTQMVLYALMIEEVYGKIVNKAYLVYCRDGNKLVDIDITEKEKQVALGNIKEYREVLNGCFPASTKYKSRCVDCCYRNICIK